MNTFLLFVMFVLASIVGTLVAGFIAMTLVLGGISAGLTTPATDVAQSSVSEAPAAIYHAPNGAKVTIS